MPHDDIVATIRRVAEEEGISPAYALAVAERESNFNPQSGGTGTIRGLYQFTGANRRKYGLSDNADVETQTRAFARLSRDLDKEMAPHLGRAPTDGERYSGHHLGGTRAARIVSGAHAGYAPSDLFSPREMAGNPHFAKARTGGELSQSIVGDIDRRMAKYGGASPENSGKNLPSGGVDFAQFGQPVEGAPDNKTEQIAQNPNTSQSGGKIDFAAFGQPHETTPVSGGFSLFRQAHAAEAPPGAKGAKGDRLPTTSFAPSNDLAQFGTAPTSKESLGFAPDESFVGQAAPPLPPPPQFVPPVPEFDRHALNGW